MSHTLSSGGHNKAQVYLLTDLIFRLNRNLSFVRELNHVDILVCLDDKCSDRVPVDHLADCSLQFPSPFINCRIHLWLYFFASRVVFPLSPLLPFFCFLYSIFNWPLFRHTYRETVELREQPHSPSIHYDIILRTGIICLFWIIFTIIYVIEMHYLVYIAEWEKVACLIIVIRTQVWIISPTTYVLVAD